MEGPTYERRPSLLARADSRPEGRRLLRNPLEVASSLHRRNHFSGVNALSLCGATVISTEHAGLACARNSALEAATGEIVAYLDDDAYPDPHWLAHLAETFLHTGHAGVGGPNLPPPDDGFVADWGAIYAPAPGYVDRPPRRAGARSGATGARVRVRPSVHPAQAVEHRRTAALVAADGAHGGPPAERSRALEESVASRILPLRRRGTFWREWWMSHDETVRQVEEQLRPGSTAVLRGGPFNRWDLDARVGAFGGARLRLAVEEHGQGRQLLRFRVWPHPSKGGVLLVLFLGLSGAAGYRSGLVAAGLMMCATSG